MKCKAEPSAGKLLALQLILVSHSYVVFVVVICVISTPTLEADRAIRQKCAVCKHKMKNVGLFKVGTTQSFFLLLCENLRRHLTLTKALEVAIKLKAVV